MSKGFFVNLTIALMNLGIYLWLENDFLLFCSGINTGVAIVIFLERIK
jgi:hypothetical protein